MLQTLSHATWKKSRGSQHDLPSERRFFHLRTKCLFRPVVPYADIASCLHNNVALDAQKSVMELEPRIGVRPIKPAEHLLVGPLSHVNVFVAQAPRPRSIHPIDRKNLANAMNCPLSRQVYTQRPITNSPAFKTVGAPSVMFHPIEHGICPEKTAASDDDVAGRIALIHSAEMRKYPNDTPHSFVKQVSQIGTETALGMIFHISVLHLEFSRVAPVIISLAQGHVPPFDQRHQVRIVRNSARVEVIFLQNGNHFAGMPLRVLGNYVGASICGRIVMNNYTIRKIRLLDHETVETLPQIARMIINGANNCDFSFAHVTPAQTSSTNDLSRPFSKGHAIDPDHCGKGGHVFRYHRIGTNSHPVPNANRAYHLGPSPDKNVFTNNRSPDPLSLLDPNGDLMKQGATLSDLCMVVHDDPVQMRDSNPSFGRNRTGRNFAPRATENDFLHQSPESRRDTP